MDKTKVLGIHLLNTKQFHYFVPGNDTQMMSIDRVRNILIARGQLVMRDGETTQYRVATLDEAEREGWEVIAHYPNKHVKKNHVLPVKKDLYSLWD